jgi:uncharacterized protein YcbX
MHAMSDLPVTLRALHLHPIKSCAGIAVAEALVIETGLEFDRAWMVVDESGGFVTQRELPRMQLVRPAFRGGELVLRAPGMLALHLRLDAAEGPRRVQVWDDSVAAFDMGDLAARWFSDFLGRPLRVVRFDPDQRRLASPRWTGGVEAEYAFADAFPLLLASTASLDELNRRLGERGLAPVTMERFRPNLVLDGLDAHGEDHLDELAFDTPDGPVRLKLVKPCARCTIPNVDPATAETGHEPGDTLATYRADPRLDGALTFGMNAIVLEGIDRTLRAGLRGEASVRF